MDKNCGITTLDLIDISSSKIVEVHANSENFKSQVLECNVQFKWEEVGFTDNFGKYSLKPVVKKVVTLVLEEI